MGKKLSSNRKIFFEEEEEERKEYASNRNPLNMFVSQLSFIMISFFLFLQMTLFLLSYKWCPHFTLLFLFILQKWTLWPKIYWKFSSYILLRTSSFLKLLPAFLFYIVLDHIIFLRDWVLAFIIHLYPTGYFLTCTSFWMSFFSSSVYSLNKSSPEFCFYSNMQCPFISDIICIAFIIPKWQ